MRLRTANWFVCRIAYDKTMEDGLQKKVKELYVVDAMSFTEAEARITDEMKSYISGEFDVQEIDRSPYHEIFFSDQGEADKWYKVKIALITIDEKNEKEKRTMLNYLVQGASLENARKNIDEVMGDTMIDYVIVGVNETAIMDVFEYAKDKEK